MQQTQATSQLYSAYRSRSSKPSSSLGPTINSPSINGNHIKLGPIQFRLCRIGRRARGERRGEGGGERSLHNQPWVSCSTIASIAVLWFIYCYGVFGAAFAMLSHGLRSSTRAATARGLHALVALLFVAQMWLILSLIFLLMSCASAMQQQQQH